LTNDAAFIHKCVVPFYYQLSVSLYLMCTLISYCLSEHWCHWLGDTRRCQFFYL